MGDTLFGKEVSGTALETRGLARETSDAFSNLIADPSGGAQRIADTFGLDVGELGLTEFTKGIFSGASPSLAGFEAANEPFQQRAISRANQGLASQFGQMGGRNSPNLARAMGEQTGELENQFNRARFDFQNQSRTTDITALASLLQMLPALQQGSIAPLVAAGQFANPGAPIYQEGIMGDLIQGGAAVLGASMGNPGPAMAMVGNQLGSTNQSQNFANPQLWQGYSPNWMGR